MAITTRPGGLSVVAAGIAALLIYLCLQIRPNFPFSTDPALAISTTHRRSPAQASLPESAVSPRASHIDLANRTLWSRATTWERAVEKGHNFVCAWQGSTVAQSEFLLFTDLEDWGWIHDPDNVEFELGPIRDPFEALGLSMETPPNIKETWQQNEDRTIDGTLYKETGGEYEQIMNVVRGVIVTVWRISPLKSIESYKAMGEDWPWPVPKLWQWSDVTFLLYQQECGIFNQEITDLEWVFHETIINQDTNNIIRQAMGDNSVTAWPGRSFHVSSEAGKALLGSPNASGTGWMLAQHKAAFPNKVVDWITVYDPRSQSGALLPGSPVNPCMAVHITDGPAGLW
ncbi:hypothetical protein LTR08_007817 [Meristemomyces frigidus]|nr:hypothetical protein LTR08_007817 [Meristemomyces frigidus]